MPCLYKKVLGIPCPGCGLTRAGKAVLAGDVGKAFHYHPLWWAVAPLLACAALAGRNTPHQAWHRRAAVGLGAAFLLLYALRLGGIPLGTAPLWDAPALKAPRDTIIRR